MGETEKVVLERWYTLEKVGQFLVSQRSPEGRSARAVRGLIKHGKLAAKKSRDGSYRVLGAEIIAFLSGDPAIAA